jgi:hypothetical protein
MSLRLLAICLFAACSSLACSGPRGRIMSDTDEDYVGARTAGAPTYDRLVTETTDKLLRHLSAARGGIGQLRIVVLGVENQSTEELGDWQEQIYSVLTTTINRAERFEMVSRRFVDEALRETRLRPEQLFLPKNQREFLAVLERQGLPIDALVFPRLTSGTTEAGDGTSQRNYEFSLELVDVQTGQTQQFGTRLRKEYQRD